VASIGRVTRRMAAVQIPVIPIVGEMVRAHPGTISLGQGVVHYPPPVPAVAAVADFFHTPANHLYGPTDGIPELREALRVKLERENGIAVGPDQRVVVTAGGNMAFMNAVLAILDAGDEVILPLPYYFNHPMAIAMAGSTRRASGGRSPRRHARSSPSRRTTRREPSTVKRLSGR
jgi:aspartate/methionine/tyrosine aminotransferase